MSHTGAGPGRDHAHRVHAQRPRGVGRSDETIIEIAKRYGIEIPHLCYKEGMRPDGNCRACVVEVKGERVLAPACCRYPKDGMEVTTDSARAVTSQKMVLELLLSDIPEKSYTLAF